VLGRFSLSAVRLAQRQVIQKGLETAVTFLLDLEEWVGNLLVLGSSEGGVDSSMIGRTGIRTRFLRSCRFLSPSNFGIERQAKRDD
jgi:hypothetical protein